jgi:fibronectin type 3 domain-containing protein
VLIFRFVFIAPSKNSSNTKSRQFPNFSLIFLRRKVAISLSGSGTAPVSYSVALSWTPSSSSFAGFNVYRGSLSGGPYTIVNSALIPTTSYADNSVAAGQTYYYVATEVNSAGVESSYSSEVSVAVP